MKENKEDNKTNKPYSYHTFLLPFEIIKENDEEAIEKVFKNNKSDNTDKKDIEKLFISDCWEEIGKDIKSTFKAVHLGEEEEKNREKVSMALGYAQRQYFHSNVINAIHNNENKNIVKEYKFKFANENKYIELGIKRKKKGANDDNKDKQGIGEEEQEASSFSKYKIEVSNVRLKLYNTGIGILILELYNDEYRDFKSVKEINELFRRISIPYIAKKEDTMLCAEKVSWNFFGEEASYDFRKMNNSFWYSDEEKKSYMIDFLDKLIIRPKSRESYKIKLSLDDRMFTCCLVQDNDLSGIYKKDYIKEAENPSEDYKELSKSLYEYIYIDTEGNCSAPTFSFRKNILNESIYHRWTEYGTVYASSHTSLVAITGENLELEYIIVRPFLTQYVEIAILALVQRASILRFQKQSSGKLKDKEVQVLQEKYVDYRNQLHFFEVSSQEQGIELYDLIRKQLYIEKEIVSLEKNLQILYEKSNIDRSHTLAWVGSVLSIVSMLGVIFNIVSSAMSGIESNVILTFLSVFLCACLCVVISVLLQWLIVQNKYIKKQIRSMINKLSDDN